MANDEHVAWVLQGPPWESLKKAYAFSDIHLDLSVADLSRASLCNLPLSRADLSNAKLASCDLSGACLIGANLKGANLDRANLNEAKLIGAGLENANLTNAKLCKADLTSACLTKANLAEADFHKAILENANLFATYCPATSFVKANLTGANLRQSHLFSADFSKAILINADLSFANLVRSVLDGADLTGANIYGLSAWNVRLSGTVQVGLKIVPPAGGPVIVVDDLEVAQFIYMVLNNERVRQVINTMTSKMVLILGRFTEERKLVLDTLRDHLRQRNLLPILFDFEASPRRTIAETVITLAGLARFIIADITDPKSIPQELTDILKAVPSVPVQPILQDGYKPWGMFESIATHPSVLDIVKYSDLAHLLRSLPEKVILPAEHKVREMEDRLRSVRASLANT